ncbi:hypothetical protein SCULI_v1c02590 [Spiroplasma culicicola AES-1]|uniref:Uncharacterized protein n=1 Tax=Spiroplasma culicicola AES-1 TaxID=1276246 RepID=W6A6U3_9MOLU|nr:hypothetical protein SCULI_v1c02590 [Spiroplasma culicicola AES-1]
MIIIVICVVIYFVIPWEKIYKRKKAKEDITNKPGSQLENKENHNSTSSVPMMGIYNWFGKSQAIRNRSLIYVQPQLDSCELCRPFENEVLSLEEYDTKYITMNEAISKGYHHIGCKHIDLDYFPGDTKIPTKQFSEQEQIEMHNKVLGMYKLENDIRNLNYRLDNANDSENLEHEIEVLTQQLEKYCQENNLKFTSKRLKASILDIDKFC